MHKPLKTFLLTSGFVLGPSVLMGQPGFAQDGKVFDTQQKEAIESIIQDYLLKNPKIVMDAAQAFQEQQMAEQKKKAESAISDNLARLTSADAPSVGAKDADVTVVEFFDYNCGYCKRALDDVRAAVKDDPKVRFVFKEMPILGPTSLTAAKWAMAAHEQGKYFEFHSAVMDHRGPKEESHLSKIAESLGLDVAKMKKDAESDAVKKQIDEDLELARTIGISGTPAFIVGKTMHGGYLGEDGLKQAIEDEREAAKNDG